MDSAHRRARLIFVGGSPRSGTTLVQNILDSHPEIYGGPEFLHLPDIITLRKKLHDSIDRGWIDVFCAHEDVDERIRGLVESFLVPLAERQGVRFLSEKTPENVLVFSDLARLLPEAHFVHVVRDPRAIIASMLQVGRRARKKRVKVAPFTRNTHTAIQYVKRCFAAGFKAATAYPERVLTVVYEDLVSHPEPQIHRICKFVGIDWDPAMLTPGEHQHAGESAITINSDQLWYDRETYYSNPDPSRLEKWRKTLTPAQQIAVVNAFRDHEMLGGLGYDLSTASLDPGTRIIGGLINAAATLGHKLPVRLIRAMRRLDPQPG